MQIVLSAHFDFAKPVPFIKLEKGKLLGLIDNFAGVFVAYQAARKTGVPLYLTNFEETGMKGARKVARNLNARGMARRGEFFRAPSRPWQKSAYGVRSGLDLDGTSQKASRAKRQDNPLVIVVDTTRDANRFPAYIGNVYGLDISRLREKFVKKIFFMPGYYEETEDETWVYGHEFHLPCFYFGVPIPHSKDYHATDNAISLRTIDRASEVLVNLIDEVKRSAAVESLK